MLYALTRFLTYFIYLRKMFGFWRACTFMFYYALARSRGDKPGRLHYIPVGPQVFYFPSVSYFAGLFNEIFFKEEYYLDQTTDSLRVFDCGANIGVALLYIKLRAPNTKVTCFEPNPASRAVLEQNIKANGWHSTVTVVPFALGAQSGEAEFYISKEGETGGDASLMMIPGTSSAEYKLHKVTVETLSQYLTERVDFLKLDIEGLEFAVLEEVAAAQKLHLVSHIQMEYHLEPGSAARPLSDMLHFLETNGFETAVQSATHPHSMMKGWRRNCLVYAWRASAL